MKFDDGGERVLWTTFTSAQIDIDVASNSGRTYLEEILDRFHAAGVSAIRLDAAGFAIKKGGTSCFMIPETFEFISGLAEKARVLGMEVLVEMHGHYEDQIQLADVWVGFTTSSAATGFARAVCVTPVPGNTGSR